MHRKKSLIVSHTGSPLEHVEQRGLIDLCSMMIGRYPDLDLLYAVPNAAKRTKGERGRLLAEGMRAGVPDLALPVARRGYFGMYVELKRADANDRALSSQQCWWLARLKDAGYYAVCCMGAADAWKEMQWYLDGDPTPRLQGS